MTRCHLLIVLALAFASGCKRDETASTTADVFSGPLPGEAAEGLQRVDLPSGLKYIELREGIGQSPAEGQMVAVHFRGYLPDRIEFDSSYKTGRPVVFRVANDATIMPAWVEAVRTMKPGGKRKLLIPPELGFGDGGRPPIVPRQTPIVVDLELVRIVPERGAEPPAGPQSRPAATRKAVSTRPAGTP